MKKAGILLSFLFFVATAFAQDSTYVTWTATADKSSDNQYALHLQGSIKAGWHLYTKGNDSEGLEGLRFSLSDRSLKVDHTDITGELKTITDPVFENKKMDFF